MKKPPYKAYQKKKEEPPIHIPEKIDTPQAEQLVSDIYKLYDLLTKHWKKLALITAIVVLMAGSWGIYKWHKISIEKQAALIVDKGLFYLRNGKEKEAIKYFNIAVSKFPNAPSSKIAAFLAGKLGNQTSLLEKCRNYKNFLVSPPATTTLTAKALDKNQINKAESLLDTIKRDKDWTYPEALEYREIAGLMKGNIQEAKDALDALKGDYQNLPITQLAQQLLSK
ncbi:hypothetical protein SAMN06265339_1630 [Desulfurobacterium pacificum]|uniref:Tetratricopeptide repeat-like domain-containing protein n=1 Tax=Desulfurobacterium pacificum TaxID=240166 RepID=A0ABY1NUX8_9BACT|nr:hypothetical protein [Desulfurobacterium pacificum]SMP18789.1 hypothetical protein SAMN06265339_1630 [Desulfurobacterium pacificum]